MRPDRQPGPPRHGVTLAPSILTADFTRLGEQVEEAEKAGADRLHLDVMDGHFVPNITFGPLLIAGLRSRSTLPFDAHLMIENAVQYVDSFREAGADRLIVHVESTDHLHRLVEQIKDGGAAAGVAINPATPIIALEEILPFIELVLVMSVNPGFGGQSFIETTLRKLFRMRRLLDRWNPEASLGVDGGVDEDTIGRVVHAGADSIVAGSAVFNDQATVEDSMRKLRRGAARATDLRPVSLPD